MAAFARNHSFKQAPNWAANTYMAEVAAAGARVYLHE